MAYNWNLYQIGVQLDIQNIYGVQLDSLTNLWRTTETFSRFVAYIDIYVHIRATCRKKMKIENDGKECDGQWEELDRRENKTTLTVESKICVRQLEDIRGCSRLPVHKACGSLSWFWFGLMKRYVVDEKPPTVVSMKVGTDAPWGKNNTCYSQRKWSRKWKRVRWYSLSLRNPEY